ncbi:GFA family protein [Sabulicella rubraurantiaca]|uniref:GFA family protein n=1 Tax=Sabulicella rubraurantiaca TaxID=2811429 RepID=UPI001A97C703|nr:GFA family protein [Sabulicella rubraurantiaca]
MKVDGQCHCGAITYEAEVEVDAIAICHCLDCQRLAGSAFRANVPAPASSFRILTGVPREYLKTGESGGRRRHAFCGSPVYSCAAENPPSYTLRVGALNQWRELGRPRRQIWVKRRLPWVPPLDGVPEVEGQP